MKKFSFSLLAASCLLLCYQDLVAQPLHGLTARYNFYNYVSPQLRDRKFADIWGDIDGGGVELAYQWCFAPQTFLVIPVKYGSARIPPSTVNPGVNHKLFNLDALLQYELFRHENLINPYFHFGVGTTFDFDADKDRVFRERVDKRDLDFNIPLGIGLNIRLTRNIDLSAQTQFRPSIRGREGWHHGVGLTYYWGPERDEDGMLSKVNDRDGDGVVDRFDRCPDVPGLASLNGCPDRDGDGIADDEDRCPDVVGTAANKGCPELAQIDKDVLIRAVRAVQFETAQATLLPESLPVLDEIASLMQRYPAYSLRIEGHTDDVGDDKMNLDLSKRRAKTCYDYLVSKGVSAGRMSHDGFGETRPIATNSTPEGREQNRRVEFELFVR
ncbi:MAG: OmpA family protein [Saprospiraceae bacterium]|nr:OmpA family protein [Saprospiraceae bacterium]